MDIFGLRFSGCTHRSDTKCPLDSGSFKGATKVSSGIPNINQHSFWTYDLYRWIWLEGFGVSNDSSPAFWISSHFNRNLHLYILHDLRVLVLRGRQEATKGSKGNCSTGNESLNFISKVPASPTKKLDLRSFSIVFVNFLLFNKFFSYSSS
jgi:hypothetical protein